MKNKTQTQNGYELLKRGKWAGKKGTSSETVRRAGRKNGVPSFVEQREKTQLAGIRKKTSISVKESRVTGIPPKRKRNGDKKGGRM